MKPLDSKQGGEAVELDPALAGHASAGRIVPAGVSRVEAEPRRAPPSDDPGSPPLAGARPSQIVPRGAAQEPAAGDARERRLSDVVPTGSGQRPQGPQPAEYAPARPERQGLVQRIHSALEQQRLQASLEQTLPIGTPPPAPVGSRPAPPSAPAAATDASAPLNISRFKHTMLLGLPALRGEAGASPQAAPEARPSGGAAADAAPVDRESAAAAAGEGEGGVGPGEAADSWAALQRGSEVATGEAPAGEARADTSATGLAPPAAGAPSPAGAGAPQAAAPAVPAFSPAAAPFSPGEPASSPAAAPPLEARGSAVAGRAPGQPVATSALRVVGLPKQPPPRRPRRPGAAPPANEPDHEAFELSHPRVAGRAQSTGVVVARRGRAQPPGPPPLRASVPPELVSGSLGAPPGPPPLRASVPPGLASGSAAVPSGPPPVPPELVTSGRTGGGAGAPELAGVRSGAMPGPSSLHTGGDASAPELAAMRSGAAPGPSPRDTGGYSSELRPSAPPDLAAGQRWEPPGPSPQPGALRPSEPPDLSRLRATVSGVILPPAPGPGDFAPTPLPGRSSPPPLDLGDAPSPAATRTRPPMARPAVTAEQLDDLPASDPFAGFAAPAPSVAQRWLVVIVVALAVVGLCSLVALAFGLLGTRAW